MLLQTKDIMKKQPKKKYDKPVSLYPLKPEDALAAFMKIDPKKVERRNQKEEKKKQKAKEVNR
jgi:hypothetical protein